MTGAAPAPDDPTVQPLPEGGWSESLFDLSDAVVVPPLSGGFVQPAGLLDSAGAYCPQGALWRKFRALTTEPAPPEGDVAHLPGRWLWGGVLWAHFGHFLVESTARLWPLADADLRVDGILFIPRRPKVGEQVRGFQRDFIDLVAPDMPVRVLTDPTRVDTLVVPGQGFGLGRITAGTASFRNAIHSRFARDIAPDGPERLYISRSALGPGKGGLLGEEHLETLLQAQGYEIFHPQQHSIATQIARYKAARQVVAADGSALHLFAMVGRADQSVAMILRRKSSANNLLAANIEHFCGSQPLIINALHTEWVRTGKKKSSRLSFGELDHAAIGTELAAAGFIAADADWQGLDEDSRRALFTDKGLGARDNFVESPQYVKKRIRAKRRERQSARAAV